MIKKLNQYIPSHFRLILLDVKLHLLPSSFIKKSFSADGEDLILWKMFGGKKNGFYVDVGSLHPKYVSNTYKLYKCGWRGINIDPNPATKKLFDLYRRNDINLQIGIAAEESELIYHEFEFAGLNTLDEEYARFRTEQKGNKIVRKSSVPCLPLRTVFEKHLHNNEIDVLDVDVEGFDLDVLKSNDWEKYRPKVILVEDRVFRNKINQSETFLYLRSQGYSFYCYCNITLVMTRDDFATI